MSRKFLISLIAAIVIIILGGVVWAVQKQPEPTDQETVNNSNSQIIEDNQDNQIVSNNNNEEKPVSEPEIVTSDIDTSNWLTYRNEELGFGFRYPDFLEAREDLIPGESGKRFILTLSSNGGNPEVKIGGLSNDYSDAGRGGSFLDSKGYSKDRGKYYFIFLSLESTIEIDVIKTIKNNWLGDVIIVDNRQWINSDSPGPWPSGPGAKIGKDNIGALINLNNSKCRGLAVVKYNPSSEVTDQIFFEMLKTFH